VVYACNTEKNVKCSVEIMYWAVIVSGKVRVYVCRFVLVGSKSVIVVWSRDGGGCCDIISQWACVVGNNVGRAGVR
jgi:hypothetical protein